MTIHQMLWIGGGDAITDTYVSYLYPVSWLESADVLHAFTGGKIYNWEVGNVNVSSTFMGGGLVVVLTTYQNWPIEKIDVVHAMTGGSLTVLLSLKTYNMLVEAVNITHTFTAGGLTVILFNYLNWPTEKVDVTHTMTGGTLT